MTERDFALDVVRRLAQPDMKPSGLAVACATSNSAWRRNDYDVATSARPEQVQELFRRTVAIGAAFGVIDVIGPRVEGGHLHVQVATFRADGEYADGRWPINVTFCSSREDALRRDFTVNGMFFDPLENRLIDYVGGLADLRAKVLRAIGDARQRFTEDKLRVLCAVRFAARFELTIDPATSAAVRAMASQLPVVSAERVAEELRKLLTDPHRGRALELLHEVGLLPIILPEVTRMHGVPQGLPHAQTGDLWQHTLKVMAHLPERVSFELALAALLHDAGKPGTLVRAPERYTFHGHEFVGRDLAVKIGERLKFSNAERDRIGWLVEKHQYLSDAPVMRPAKLKVILNHEGVHELLMLHRADALASGRAPTHVEFAEAKLRAWTASGELNPPPLLTGDDLKELGIPPGKVYKQLLDAVREAQLDGTIGALRSRGAGAAIV